MSTRSTIAILRTDGTVSQVYAHWDGYLSNNGVILQWNYQDPKKIEKLISLGSVSSLDKEVDIPPGSTHDFNTRAPGVTTFYGRDRGEKDVDPAHFKNLDDYKAHCDFQGYDYLFKEENQTWYLYNSDTQRLNKLSTALKNDSESVNNLTALQAEKEKKMLVDNVALSDKPTRQVKVKV